MDMAKASVQWAERTLRTLSDQKYTGTVTIRFSQGGVQGMVVSQELHPKIEGLIAEPVQQT